MTISALSGGYWRVASYGYPSPFGNARAVEAWAKFEAFAATTLYSNLKDDLFDATGLSAHAVESWKSAFEKFGLLYVLPGSNSIVLTPAGAQLLAAGAAGDEAQFAWVGLNTLFRVPVGGWRRGNGGGPTSTVLGYRFVHAAILDLDDRLWFEELQILTQVTTDGQFPRAIEAVRRLRDDPSRVEPQLTGDAYNLTRQVAVQTSLNYLVLTQGSMTNPYGRTTKPLLLNSSWRDTVVAALSVHAETDACSSGGEFVPRMPAAPSAFANEEAYFAYVGAPVPAPSAGSAPSPVVATIQGESVRILRIGASLARLSPDLLSGPISELCSLARGDRVILTDDHDFSYKVEAKQLLGATTVQVSVRRAKPIVDYSVVLAMLGGIEE